MSDAKRHPVSRLIVVSTVAVMLFLLVGGIFFIMQNGRRTMPDTHSMPTAILPSPTPSLTPQPLFFEDFSSNKKGWSVGDISGYKRMVYDNRLTLSDTNHKILIESLPTSNTFDNFSLTMSFTLTQGDSRDSVGLYLRGDSNLDHDYRIDVFGNNTYAVSKEYLDATNSPARTFLVSPSHVASLHPKGEQNTLAVVMKGSSITVAFNGTSVVSATDVNYKRGQIALFVENGGTSNGVTASFWSIVIYQIPVAKAPSS